MEVNPIALQEMPKVSGFANPTLSNGRRRLPLIQTKLDDQGQADQIKQYRFYIPLNGEESNQKAFHRILGQANAHHGRYNIVFKGM